MTSIHTSPAVQTAATFPWKRVLPWMAATAAGLYGLSMLSVELAALLFVVIYFMVAYSQPSVALMVIFISAPFPHNIAPGALPVNFSMSEFTLALCCVALAIKQAQGFRPMRFGPLLWPTVIYLAVCAVSGVFYFHGNATIKSYLQMMVYMFGAVIVFSSMVDYKHQLLPALYALLAVGCFQAIGTIHGGMYAMGMHKNAIGASLGGIFVVAFELWFQATDKRARWILTPVLLFIGAGLMMSLSRGAWFGTGCGCVTILALRRQWKAMIKITLIGLPVVALCYLSWSAGVQEYAFNLEPGGHNSVQERYENARQFWNHFEKNPLIGAGTGMRKLIDATNIVLSTLAETGVLGLVTFAGIFVVFFRMVWWTHKRVSLDDPLFSLLAVGAGLMVARLGHGMFDHYWSRGALTAAWAAAGMATLAYLNVKARQRPGLR
jgi:hypothetical protein